MYARVKQRLLPTENLQTAAQLLVFFEHTNAVSVIGKDEGALQTAKAATDYYKVENLFSHEVAKFAFVLKF